LFGNEANLTKAVHFQDWSTEKFTANIADRKPLTRHPHYGLNLLLGSAWGRKLDFISTETSFSNGGLIEGALEAGLRFSNRVTGVKMPLIDDAHTTYR
jgi:monoamine oxidase